jgi:hypothetical protein
LTIGHGRERFPCLRVPAFRRYAARMGAPAWQAALAAAPSARSFRGAEIGAGKLFSAARS